MSKELLVDALHTVPDVLLDRIFGDFPDIATPTTEEESIIAIGVLSANLNNLLLKPLSGLDIVELLLRVGQKNSTAIDALLSNLEVISGSGGKMQIDSPKNGETLPFVKGVVVSGIGIKTASATLNDTEFSLEEAGGVWNYMFDAPLPSGEYSLKISAEFDDGAQGSAISIFTVEAAPNAFAPLSPLPGQSVAAGDVPFSGHGVNVTGVSVSVDGPAFELASNGEEWTASVVLIPGEYTAYFITSFQDGTSRPEAPITFTVTA